MRKGCIQVAGFEALKCLILFINSSFFCAVLFELVQYSSPELADFPAKRL